MDLKGMYRGDAVATTEGRVGLVVTPDPTLTLVMFSPRDLQRVPTCLLRRV
jgi:hypothetical protein